MIDVSRARTPIATITQDMRSSPSSASALGLVASATTTTSTSASMSWQRSGLLSIANTA